MSHNASRVLIVDDMPLNRLILSSLLASNGVTADLAEGGAECIELCEKNHYDLILLDHRMPEIDGVDALLQLKEIFRRTGREIPVVCHTTEDARNNINLYKAAGFADVLIKPIQPKQLFDILMTYLPEGNEEEEKSRTAKEEAQARVEAVKEKLPSWIADVPNIDLITGIEHCETAEDYLDALTVFASSITEKANEIERFAAEQNWQMYTLRVHSLKSMARLIGANSLGEAAADLEYAGKHGDIETLEKWTPQLLINYRAFVPALSALFAPADEEHRHSPARPTISRETLSDAYGSIADFVSCYDAASVSLVLKSLREYDLSPEDAEKVNQISAGLARADWESLREILS